MSVHADHWIQKMASEQGMIEPFEPAVVRDGKISYGCSSYGYDFRVADEFHLPPASQDRTFVIDPKQASPEDFQKVTQAICAIPPHQFVMARSLEYFRIPRDVIAICFGKSTYARSGILVNITPLEPEWEGYLTFPIVNLTAHPAKVYAHEGIAQLLFLEAAEVCAISYQDRKGKYQKQDQLTFAKL